MSRQLGFIILSGYAALTAMIMDNHSTFITKQASLPPWAVELNRSIDAQIIGTIINIIETKGGDITLHIQIDKHLTKGKSKVIAKSKVLKLRVHKQMHKELINSYTRNSKTRNNSSYLISLKAKEDDSIEHLELVTIDPYIAE